jgi:hypothetical protein
MDDPFDLGPLAGLTVQLDATPELARDFAAGCLRSGMNEAICEACGRPWLTRIPRAPGSTGAYGWGLCPVCNPEHVGFEPAGPTDAPRWMTFWRTQFVELLRFHARNQAFLADLDCLVSPRSLDSGYVLDLIDAALPNQHRSP